MSDPKSTDLMYRLLVQGVTDYAIYLLDEDGRILNWNTGAERAKGYKAEEIVGQNYEVFFTEGDRAKGLPARNLRTARAKGHFTAEGWRLRRDGSRFWASVMIDPVYDEAGTFIGFAKITRDLSEQRDADRRLLYVANHDPLTGLANRAFFNKSLEDQMPQVAYGASLAVHYVDLDRFKPVNDTFGHSAGDELLEHVARRLEAEVGANDVVARLGGDEFAVLQVSASDDEEAGETAKKIIAALSRPFVINNSTVVIGASIGIAMAPRDGYDAIQLLQNADLALYEAKQQGRGRFSFFNKDLVEQATNRHVMELKLRHAVGTNGFTVYYQPIVEATSGQPVAFEALLRWKDQSDNFISPADFVPAAEKLGLMPEIGAWVLHTACREAASWPGEIAVSVNVSATQLRSTSFIQTVCSALFRSGLAAHRLELELTETAILSDVQSAAEILQELRSMGVKIALDDFGTGFSSLSLVNQLPLNRLKIDQSFVRQLNGSEQANAVVRAVTSLCKGFGLSTTAEGVETVEQKLILIQEGCQHLQGYLFGRPQPQAVIPQTAAQDEGGKQAAS